MKDQFTIVEKFEIEDRGAVVVIDDVTDQVPGKAYIVEVTGVDGQTIRAEAFKEWLLRRNPTPVEKEAFILKGVHKHEISDDAVISFLGTC